MTVHPWQCDRPYAAPVLSPSSSGQAICNCRIAVQPLLSHGASRHWHWLPMLQLMLCMQGQRHEESDSQDDWTDEEDDAEALDAADPFLYFADTLRAVQMQHPARFQVWLSCCVSRPLIWRLASSPPLLPVSHADYPASCAAMQAEGFACECSKVLRTDVHDLARGAPAVPDVWWCGRR